MLPLPDFTRARVLVCGDVMLDRYWTGATQRISPEAPVPVVHVKQDEGRPGGGANVALNLSALGAHCRLLGVVGRDAAADTLRSALSDSGVESQWIEAADAPTITKLRVISRHQQVIRLDFEEPFAAEGAFDRARLIEQFTALLADADVAVLSDYAKGTLRDIPALIAQARALGKPILIDPKSSDFSRYRGASLLTPNVAELEAVVGSCPDETSLVERGQALCREHELGALLVTRSEKGMSLLRPGVPPLHLPTEAREVFDVTGAGDTVIAALAASLAAGAELDTATRLANVAAGLVVAKLGTATVSRAEIEAALHPPARSNDVVMSKAKLQETVRKARARGDRVVMTNGVFDLLHVGHVQYLEAARELGDLLIIAVNEDASVKRLKGDARPINRCEDRMRVLAGLRCVDAVTSFADDTPAELIADVLPDVLVKGGDYRPEDIAGGDAVRAAGGDVVVLDFVDGYSTTRMLGRAGQ